jgi:hypothetical protein
MMLSHLGSCHLRNWDHVAYTTVLDTQQLQMLSHWSHAAACLVCLTIVSRPSASFSYIEYFVW